MISRLETKVVTQVLDSITCDVCGKTYLVTSQKDSLEIEEFSHINFTGGYASVFGDSNNIVCDICQHCLRSMIEKYCYLQTEEGLIRFKDTLR